MKRTIERPINRTGSAALLLIGMALLVGLTGYLVGDDRRLILLGLFGVLPLMVISLRYFEPIVLAMPLVALAIPISLPAGGSRISAAMLLVMLLAGIWILAAIVIRRGVTLQRSALNAPMLAFAAVCVLSFGWSIAFRDPLLINYPNFILVQLGALAALVLSPIAALLIANFARTPRQLWWIAAPFLVVGVAFSLARVLGRDVPVVKYARALSDVVRGASVRRGDRPTEAAAVDAHRARRCAGHQSVRDGYPAGGVAVRLGAVDRRNRGDHAVPVTFLVSGARRRAARRGYLADAVLPGDVFVRRRDTGQQRPADAVGAELGAFPGPSAAWHRTGRLRADLCNVPS